MEELHEMAHENALQIINHIKTSLIIVLKKKGLVIVIKTEAKTKIRKTLPDYRTTRGGKSPFELKKGLKASL